MWGAVQKAHRGWAPPGEGDVTYEASFGYAGTQQGAALCLAAMLVGEHACFSMHIEDSQVDTDYKSGNTKLRATFHIVPRDEPGRKYIVKTEESHFAEQNALLTSAFP